MLLQPRDAFVIARRSHVSKPLQHGHHVLERRAARCHAGGVSALRRLRRRFDIRLAQPLMVKRIRSAVSLAHREEPRRILFPLSRGPMRVELIAKRR